MDGKWNLQNIDLALGVEVIASQNPETSLRVNIPVPNWLGDDGKPFVQHPCIGQKDDGAWRYFFTNEKDGCLQNVEIDGTSVITFMGVSPEKAEQFVALVEAFGEAEKLTPDVLTKVLERSAGELGIVDRYDNPRSGVDKYMHPFALSPRHPYLGAFLPMPNLSMAVFLPGAGEFADGPTSTPQKFEDGAFVVFPGKSRDAVLEMDSGELKAKGKARLVQADVFVASRTYPDGSAIVLKDLIPIRGQSVRGTHASSRPEL
jgi:hypothetical protein